MKASEFLRLRLKKLTYSAMFLAIALLLPQIFHQFGDLGRVLLPMHLPVLLCGFACGWPWGLAVGLVSPIISSTMFGMPPLFPVGVAMTFELAAYGALTGLLLKFLPKKIPYIYVNLILSMIAGRLVSCAVQFLIAGLRNTEFSFSAFWNSTIAVALPGIVIQILLIPPLVIALRRAGLQPDN